jgi:hypothetical protein
MKHKLVLAVAFALLATAAWGEVKKAVYYDPTQTQGWMGMDARDLIHDYFVSQGYEDLDSAGVKAWMDARIQDHIPSVIVMSQDIYPSTIVEVANGAIISNAPTTLRKYLDAGGKVVHMADWPIYYVSVDGANINPAGGGATLVLGMSGSDYGDPAVDTEITADGTKWGLTQTWSSQRAINPANADVVLAQRVGSPGAAGWVRRYALLPSSGFVRLWDCACNSGNITEDVLADIQRVAEYGLDQVSGIGTIKGVLLDQNGKPLPQQQVKVAASFGTATAVTDDNGAFSLVAAAGTFKASATGKLIIKSDPVDVTVTAGQVTNITLTAEATQPFVYYIAKAKTPITIDGVATDAEWGDAQTMVLNKPEQFSGGTYPGPDFLSGVFRVKFDDQYLYVTADITDQVPRINVHTDGSIWQGDGIETYVGLDGYDSKRTSYNESRNYQWTIGAGSEIAWKIFRPVAGDRQPPDIPDIPGNLVIKDHGPSEKPGYVIEARMPWSGFPDADPTLIPPKEGTPASIQAAINDNNDPTVAAAREFGMMFEPTTEAWHDPSTWVRAQWGAAPAPSVVKGDLSGDGKLAINDVTLALQIAVGLRTASAAQLAAGDLDGNGSISIAEVTKILKAAVGLGTL